MLRLDHAVGVLIGKKNVVTVAKCMHECVQVFEIHGINKCRFNVCTNGGFLTAGLPFCMHNLFLFFSIAISVCARVFSIWTFSKTFYTVNSWN